MYRKYEKKRRKLQKKRYKKAKRQYNRERSRELNAEFDEWTRRKWKEHKEKKEEKQKKMLENEKNEEACKGLYRKYSVSGMVDSFANTIESVIQ